MADCLLVGHRRGFLGLRRGRPAPVADYLCPPLRGGRLLGRIQHGRIVDYVRVAFCSSLGGGHVGREHLHVLVVGLVQVQTLPDKVQASRAAVRVDVVDVLDVLVGVLLEELDDGVGPLLLERGHHVGRKSVIAVHLARPPAVAQLHPDDVAVIVNSALFAHLGTISLEQGNGRELSHCHCPRCEVCRGASGLVV